MTNPPFEVLSSSPDWEVGLQRLPLANPFHIAHGASSERTVLRVRYGRGCGEAPFIPYYDDKPAEVADWLREFGLEGPPRAEAFIDAPRVVRLAMDLLRHDLEGKRKGVPLWQSLSLPVPNAARACRSFGIPPDVKDFSEKIRKASIQFPILKLKLGSGNADFDEAIVATAREAAPAVTLFGDVNGGWSVLEAVRLLPKMQRLGLAFVEQPIHHSGGVEAWRALRSALPSRGLPLYADESVQTISDLHLFADWIDGVNVKLLKAGGVVAALELLSTARAHGMRTILGCMIESSLGVTAAAHLAGTCDWADLDGHLYLADDDFTGLTFDKAGRIQVPDLPGIGVAPRPRRGF